MSGLPAWNMPPVLEDLPHVQGLPGRSAPPNPSLESRTRPSVARSLDVFAGLTLSYSIVLLFPPTWLYRAIPIHALLPPMLVTCREILGQYGTMHRTCGSRM